MHQAASDCIYCLPSGLVSCKVLDETSIVCANWPLFKSVKQFVGSGS